MKQLPEDHATLRLMAGPNNVNASGDIFGGWLIAQADVAGSIVATRCIKGRVVTVAVENFHFIKPVLVGDLVSLYGELNRIGKSSIQITVTIYIERKPAHDVIVEQVAQGQFVYVHLDEDGDPRTI